MENNNTTQESNSTQAPVIQPQTTQSSAPTAQQPVIQPIIPTPESKPSKPHKKIWITLLVVLIILLVCGGVFALYHSKHNTKTKTLPIASKSTVSTKTSTQNSTSACPASSTANLKSQQTVDGVNIKYISVSPDLVNGGQAPEYSNFSTGCGHYVYIDQAASSGFSSGSGGTLIYDGKTIYSGANLSSAALSQNGQHFAYELITTQGTAPYIGTTAIYVDGKLVKTGDNITLVAVSNDGKSFAYTQQTSKLTPTPVNSGIPGENLYVSTSSSPLYSWPLGFLGVSSGVNLSNYLAQLPPSSQDYQLAYNGRTVDIGQEPQEVVASPSANHYGYTIASAVSGNSTTGGEVNVDGKIVAQNAQFAGLQVTDNGDYAYYNENSQQVVIDGKSYPVTGLPSGSGGVQVYINQNASDHLIGITPSNTTMWQLNGNSINVGGTVDNAEFDNNTLYVYLQS